MRVLVLSAGQMGSVAAYLLAKHGKAELRLGDKNAEKVAKVAADINRRIGSDIVKSEAVDVENPVELRRSMKSVDIVVNCVGPYYRYGINTIKAAIETGVKYADICDELIAAKEIMKLDAAAKKAGTTVLTSLGSSPGLSNIQVQYSEKDGFG